MFEELIGSQIVIQSNKLIEAHYSLTLYEQRLILMMIAMVEPEDRDFKDYAIRISDFNKILGLKHKGSYDKIKDILRGLRIKELVINQGGKDYLITGWISDAEYKDSKGIVLVSFSKKLKPYLLALKNNFTIQRLNILLHFKGTHTIRIYALLKQYEDIGVREIELEDFKKILGLQKNQYDSYYDFKRRTLLPAQKEFAYIDDEGFYISDLTFRLEEIKENRKVIALRFVIIRQHTNQERGLPSLESLCIPDNQPNAELKYPEVYETLIQLSIEHDTAVEWLDEYGGQYVQEKIDFIRSEKENGRIRSSLSGFLASAIKGNYRSEVQSEQEKQENEIQERVRQEKQKRKDQLREKLVREFERKAREVYLNSLTPEQYQVLLNEVLSDASLSDFVVNIIRKSALRSSLAFGEVSKRIKNFSEKKEAYIANGLKKAGFDD